MKKFSSSWISSIQPRKQRKYRYNAPVHIKRKFLGSTLSKELRKKHGIRSISVVTGDKVLIMRGQYKKQEGKVDKVNVKEGKVFVTGAERDKKDGSKSMYPLNASNLMITELNLNDKKRLKSKKSEE